MSDLIGIVFVRGKKPVNVTIELATIKKYPFWQLGCHGLNPVGNCIKEGARGCSEVK
jgi:hypothetical protein